MSDLPPYFDPKNNPFFDPKNNPFFDPKNNPFLDPQRNPFMSKELGEMFAGFHTPHVDLQEVIAAQRKNFEAIAAANRTAVEGIQAVFKRQSEIMKELMEEMNGVTRDLGTSGSAEDQAARQVDALKTSIEETVANMRELSEMMAKSQNEAFDILNKRLTENLDELRKQVSTVKAGSKSSKGK